jgi:23S rRNA (uracil1939-C5)-methyltransferase
VELARRSRAQHSDPARTPSRRGLAVAAETTSVEIERLASGGDGVGRLDDGCIIFVPFAAPGDRLRVRVTLRKARHARGEIVGVERAGPARREPRCEVFGRCGGCSWQHLAYEAQLETKRRILIDALERIGGLSPPGDVRVCASPRELGYRTRARVVAAGGRVGFRPARSHELLPIETCPVLAPELDAALARAASLGPARGEGGDAVEVELAVGSDGTVRIAPARGASPGAGEPAAELAVGEDRLRISAGVFAQANASLLAPLRAAVLRAVGDGSGVAELFCGAGLFTLGLARRFERVLAVEANTRATRDLAFNLERAGNVGGVEILTLAVERALPRVAAFAPDVVVLDPPRTGLERPVRDRLGGLGAGRIVYVSCDPATLARDLRVLCDTGYSLVHLEAFDLFPQTHHVESLAVLERGGGGADG